MKTAVLSWLASLGVGVLVAVPGALLAGWLATRAVDWLHVPSREGASGYFVVFMGLGGAVLGLVVGIVASRYFGTSAGGSFMRALGVGLGAHLLLLLGIAGIVRLRADVPPTIDGQQLHLVVEASWPAALAPALRDSTNAPYVVLGAYDGNTIRARSEGPLWRDLMRVEDGRVVLPGAVEVFTSRGPAVLFVNTGLGDGENGFTIPLPGRPTQRDQQWSAWIERGNPTWGKVPAGFAVRYRVITRNAPVRTDRVGPFEVDTIASAFSIVRQADEGPRQDAVAHFVVRVDGEPLQLPAHGAQGSGGNPEAGAAGAASARIDALAPLPGEPPALVVLTDAQYGHGHCRLLQQVDGTVRVEDIEHCDAGLTAERIPPSGEAVEQDATRAPRPSTHGPRVRGAIDRETFATPGLYLFAGAVLDTRSRVILRLPGQRTHYQLDTVAPLSLAPDERRFVRIAHGENTPVLAEIDLRDGSRRDVPIGDAPVASGNWQDADAGWFTNYFTWAQDGSDGYRVTRRDGARPVARRGRLSNSSGYREYRLSPVEPAMRDAFVAFLVSTLGGHEKATDAGGFAREVELDGGTIHVGLDGTQLAVFMMTAPHTELVAEVAARFDAALASGRYDEHFLRPQGPAVP